MSEGGQTLIIGHRGAPRRAPENTMASFAAALALGAAGVELDVQLSRDGVLVVIHDLTLDRTTSGTGPVSDLTFAELRALDAGRSFSPAFADERIPTLREVADLVRGKIELQVEIKGTTPGIVAATVSVLKDARMLDDTLITSFHHALVREVRDVEPRVRTGILLYRTQLPEHPTARAQEAVNLAVAARADHIDPHVTAVTPELVAFAHASGLGVATWTVDDPDEVRRVAAAGVDRMTTNVPDLARAALGQGLRASQPSA